MKLQQYVNFPEYSEIRCLMMPYVQGDPSSVPEVYAPYKSIIESVFIRRGDVGFLTIDESPVKAGSPHRGAHAKYPRALHTEVGIDPENKLYCWGGGWGSAPHRVTLDGDVRILLANNLDDSCAVWESEHRNTSEDGDIGDCAKQYPYKNATFLKAGEVHEIGIFTPHESLPVKSNLTRQFLRIVSSGVHGREDYFTINSKMRL